VLQFGLDTFNPHSTRYQKQFHGAMDFTSKLLLDEMKINQRLNGFDGRFTKLDSSVEALGARLKPIEDKEDEAADWKKELDSSVADLVTKVDAVEQLAGKVDSIDELHQQISNLNNKLDRVVLNRGGSKQGILPKPEVNAATPSAGNPFVGPDGHRFDTNLRENGFRSVMAYTQLPVKSTYLDPPPKFHSQRHIGSSGPAIVNTIGRWPKLPFPKFEGDNPKLWQSRCENYFDMSRIDKSNWVRISAMYFDGPTARWMQSIENRANSASWDTFCKLDSVEITMKSSFDSSFILSKQILFMIM
jgi:uncharacterized protein YhaN